MLRDARYEIVAQNGQVLEHSIKSHKEAVRIAWSYKMRYEDDCFEIREYEAGKYGADYM